MIMIRIELLQQTILLNIDYANYSSSIGSNNVSSMNHNDIHDNEIYGDTTVNSNS